MDYHEKVYLFIFLASSFPISSSHTILVYKNTTYLLEFWVVIALASLSIGSSVYTLILHSCFAKHMLACTGRYLLSTKQLQTGHNSRPIQNWYYFKSQIIFLCNKNLKKFLVKYVLLMILLCFFEAFWTAILNTSAWVMLSSFSLASISSLLCCLSSIITFNISFDKI